jgi:hypothetical protein
MTDLVTGNTLNQRNAIVMGCIETQGTARELIVVEIEGAAGRWETPWGREGGEVWTIQWLGGYTQE